ncbi:AAA family ATPase [bacterium]|nr:AAA family ATPase [bacterium]
MPITIAVCGKGGVGKSTIAALIIRWLNDKGVKSILAVDADANVNLNDLLGAGAGEPIGAIREEMKDKVNDLPGGMTKQQFLEYKIHQSLVETPDFDLITMGRPEGPGCYCYANSLLRDILKTLSDNYQYVVIDNEAGMEHLSRRTTQNIDYMFIVSGPSVRGIQTAGRIDRLLKELDTRVENRYLIINRACEGLSTAIEKQIAQEGLELLFILYDDDEIRRLDSEGKPIYDISKKSKVYDSFDAVLSGCFKAIV